MAACSNAGAGFAAPTSTEVTMPGVQNRDEPEAESSDHLDQDADADEDVAGGEDLEPRVGEHEVRIGDAGRRERGA